MWKVKEMSFERTIRKIEEERDCTLQQIMYIEGKETQDNTDTYNTNEMQIDVQILNEAIEKLKRRGDTNE